MGRPLAQKYANIATKYAKSVVAGKVVACKWVLFACERHLSDLKRAGNKLFPYTFNPVLVDTNGKKYLPAERICGFAELMPHIKGDWAGRGELIELQPWQVFILASIFGWIKQANGRRRFRQADLFVPKKNAKSTLGSVIGNYCLTMDGEFGAEVYSGATSEYQANQVFMPSVLMARATPEFIDRYGVIVPVAMKPSNMAVPTTNSKYEPIIGKPGHGASTSCALVDEYHEHPTADLYETLQTGMAARSQPLIIVMTTAGTDISSPCYMHQVELQKILAGTLKDEQRFGIIFTIDKEDSWGSVKALKKANPNYGISVDKDFVKTQQAAALSDARKQNAFKTMHLNLWVAARSPWLNMQYVQGRCQSEVLNIADFKGIPAHIGLDIANKIDIASKIKVFKKIVEAQEHYFMFSRNYVPDAALEKPENTHYRAWVEEGFLVATPGSMISISTIEADILADAELHPIKEVCIDQWGAAAIAANLQEEGLTVVDIPQTVKYLSDPMKFIQAIIEDGRFHHDGNPCTVWMLSNVEVKPDANENIFPRKLREQHKIDAAVALLCATNRASQLDKEQDISEFLLNPIIG